MSQENKKVKPLKESQKSAELTVEQRAQEMLDKFTLKAMTARHRTKLIAEIMHIQKLYREVESGNQLAFEELVDASYSLMGAFVEEDQSVVDEIEFEDLGIIFPLLVEQMTKKKA